MDYKNARVNWSCVDINCYDSKITEIDFNTPANKKEIPCDTCEYEDTCGLKILECSAFRNWASTGDYKETDVTRLLRAAQMHEFLLGVCWGAVGTCTMLALIVFFL